MTCRTLETFYHINAHTFEKQYKETLSGFRGWEQLDHADTWLLFTENMGPHLAIDETSLSNGELRLSPTATVMPEKEAWWRSFPARNQRT